MTQIIHIGAVSIDDVRKGTFTFPAPAGFPTLVSVGLVIDRGGSLCLKLVWS